MLVDKPLPQHGNPGIPLSYPHQGQEQPRSQPQPIHPQRLAYGPSILPPQIMLSNPYQYDGLYVHSPQQQQHYGQTQVPPHQIPFAVSPAYPQQSEMQFASPQKRTVQDAEWCAFAPTPGKLPRANIDRFVPHPQGRPVACASIVGYFKAMC